MTDLLTHCARVMLLVMDEVRLLLVKLRRLLRSRGRSVDDTDDLIQEAFLRLQLYCRDHAVHKPEAFLVRTALNLSADQSKRERQARIEPGALERLTPESFPGWLTRKYDPEIVVKLNASARGGTYREDIWRQKSGKTSAELGQEWKEEKAQLLKSLGSS